MKEHGIRNIDMGAKRYPPFTPMPTYPNGDFNVPYSGLRSRSGGMLPTGYLESPSYRTNYSSTQWKNFTHDAESRGKWISGLTLGLLIGIGMYGVSMLTDRVMGN